MKIFLSHSSANREYGNALVELLRGIGIKENEIIFTSNIAYGIPIGQNIYNWLKSQITEKPFVIYLLSKEYYSSIACLNEMGAAWVIENEHAMLFTPNFDLSSKEFQNGAIDPREIGFYINDEERLLSFIQHLEKYFNVTKNSVIINQVLRKYLKHINDIPENKKEVLISLPEKHESEKKIQAETDFEIKEETLNSSKDTISVESKSNKNLYSKFKDDILTGKLKDEELILLHYMSETGRIKLMTGWQEHVEIENIKAWEEIEELDDVLSKNFASVIRKLAMRGYSEVSATTSSNNPKEIKLKLEIENHIIDLPNEIIEVIQSALKKNPVKPKRDIWGNIPF